MKKLKYISPAASLSEACRLENRLCALSTIETKGASFNKVTFKKAGDDEGTAWEDSWTD